MFEPIDAVAQCSKCLQVMSIDMVDVMTQVKLIHKDPQDPRYRLNPCGGTIHLFQEIKR